MNKIFIVAGARPNFMKIAPIQRAMEGRKDLKGVLIHTGQHYDASMSDSMFKDLGIRNPDYNLDVGSGSHAMQTANIMVKFEAICLKEKPDLVLVVGDVNSTIAAGLVAKKLQILLAHVEAGLRSRDRSMPEEINRLATDAITDLFFTTEKEANENLLMEGISSAAIHFVGHVMIDNLYFQIKNLKNAAISDMVRDLKRRLPEKYICMTMHRPSNVDNQDTLTGLLNAINIVADECPIIFPCHPRTKKMIENVGLNHLFRNLKPGVEKLSNGIYLTESLGYNDFLYLWKDANLVLTDSGGLQEETTALKVPCITLRQSTERPITAEIGSNVVVGTDVDKIISLSRKALAGEWKESRIPDLWDGEASERIIEIIAKKLG